MKAFLDIETGGFSITKNGICEIAIVVVNAKYDIIDAFHCLIKPYTREGSDQLVSYKDDAMKVNGLSVEQLEKEGIHIDTALSKLISFLETYCISTFIGHNSKAFDIPRIAYLLKRFKQYSVAHLKQEDTILIARRKLRLKSYSLGNLCKYFGIINQKEHSAIDDTLATIELYKKLISR